jgi:hypothetical protein
MAPDSFQLNQRAGPTPGKTYALSKNEIYLGRDITNDIVINDPEISRKHARLTYQSGGYLLEDLGSTNGTFIDGQRITGPHMMTSGEVIMLGDNVSLTYEGVAYDPEATVAVAPEDVGAPGTPYPIPPQPVTGAEPRFTGQVPPGPGTAPIRRDEERTGGWRIWVLAGCGCLVVLLCIIAAGFVVFDTMNLYCTPPFDAFLCP